MKITCALSQSQSEKLYKTVYKSLSEALKSGEPFDYEAYMSNLFDKIADKKDEDTAVKFLQQVPSIIRTIAAKPSFDNLDVKLDPIKDLSKSFKDEADGFSKVQNFFKPQISERAKLALIRANEIEAIKVPEGDSDTKIVDPVRLRPFSALVSTMQQLFSINPNDKASLVEELVDTAKNTIYATMESIRQALVKFKSNDIIPVFTYQNKVLKLKPVLLTDLKANNKEDLDKTTLAETTRAEVLAAKNLSKKEVEGVNKIAIVLSDENGEYLYFDSEGNITTKEKGGKLVYQFLRDVRTDNGKYKVTNSFGYETGIQTPADIAEALGITLEEAEKQQQEEFKSLYNLRQRVLKGESTLLDLIDLTPGVKESVTQKKITLKNLRELPFVNNSTFRTIVPVMTGGKVAAKITLNGKEYGIHRPNLPVTFGEDKREPGELIKKIAAVLSNPKLSNGEKYEYVSQFLSDTAVNSTRRHTLYYDKGTDTLTFSYNEKTLKEGSGKKYTFINEEINGKGSIIEDVLLNAAGDSKNYFSAKMSYNDKALERNGYFDYNMENGTFDNDFTPYIPFLETLPNTEIMMDQQTDPGFFNSHMVFAIPTQFAKDIEEAVKTETPSENTETDIEAQRADIERRREEDLRSIKYHPGNMRNMPDYVSYHGYTLNGERFEGSSPNAVRIDNGFRADTTKKAKELINAKYNAELAALGTPVQAQPTPTQDQSINDAINPPNTNEPSEGGSGISFDWDRKGLDRNGVIEEQVKNAKEWWSTSPLAKYMDFETMVNLVNSDVYAKFIRYGSVLNGKFGKILIGEKGTMVDVYHEAWHAFSQIFLTPEQRTRLYNEVAKQPGSFTLLDGTTVAFKDASSRQLEEYLAEDFRDYGVNQSVKKGQPARNTLFRTIYNFIKNFFSSKSTKDKLFKELYFAKSNPKFINKYTPNISALAFKKLNRGLVSLTDSDIDALDKQDLNLLTESADSWISEKIDTEAKNRNSKSGSLRVFLGENNKKALYTLLKQDFTEKLVAATNEYNAIINDETKELEAEKLNNKIRIFKAAIDNFGDNTKGFQKHHLENTTFNILRQKYKEQEQEVEEGDTQVKENLEGVQTSEYDPKLGDKSLLDLASKETIYILKSLHKVVDKKFVYNELGYRELASFTETWNNLMRAVNGEKNPQQIYENIKQAGLEVYPEFKQLISSKLPNPSSTNTQTNLNDKLAETKLMTNFWQDVQKTRVTYLQTTIFENNIAEVTKASIETMSLANKFQAKFKSDLTNDFVDRSTDTNVPMLNLQKIVDRFGKDGRLIPEESYNFARAIGFYLDNLRAIKKDLVKDQRSIEAYGLPFIYKLIVDLNRENNKPNISAESRKAITDFRLNPLQGLMKGVSADVFGKVRTQKNNVEKILGLQAKYGADSSNFAVLNAERNLVFEHMDDHSVSMIVYALNKVKDMKEFWTEGSEFEFLSYLNPEINSFTNRSQVLNTLFDLGMGMEKRDGKLLQLFVNSGTQVENGEGTNTTALDVQGKFLQELHSMLKGGVQEFMRHASKSSSFGARIDGGIIGGRGKGDDTRLWVDLDKFARGSDSEYTTRVHMIPYIAAEVERINKFKSNKALFKTYAGYNRPMADGTMAGENFTAFDDVLTDDTKKEILEKVTDPNMKLEDYLKNDSDLARKIQLEVDAYFGGQTSDLIDFYNQASYMSPDLLDRLKLYELSETDATKVLMKAYTVNAWIQNFEMANLFYGDIVQYNHEKEELHKRNTGSTSGGLKIRTDEAMRNFLNGLNKEKSYAATLPGVETLTYNGKYNTAILQDVKRNSVYVDKIKKALEEDYIERFSKTKMSPEEIKSEVDRRVAIEIDKYMGMEEGDGQGWITIDAYRSLKIASGEWSDVQENLFDKIIKNEPVKASDVVELFPVYKAQNYGHLADTALPIMAMHKFALAPMIPSMIKGSDLEKLHMQMMKKNIQYVTFQTGSKVGSVTSEVDKKGKAVADKIYADDEQKTLLSDIKFTPNTIYLEYLKDVTKVPTSYKGRTVFSTQLRKLILSNLYEKGLIDKHADVIKDYENTVDEYGNLLKMELLNDIGYEYKDGKYIGNFTEFLKVIQNELTRRDLPEHHIEFINANPDNSLKTDLSLHLKSDDIEKILVALMEKRLVKQKIKGEALVQVSSAMTNGLWDSGLKNATEEEIRKYMGSNNLPFYDQTENGTSAMKVAIALQGDFVNLLKVKHNDGKPIETRERLNQMIKDDKWMAEHGKTVSLSAVRIPVQGLNSMEYMQVYEFLDPSAGNIIIPPSEIVAKSGADFDVDKLTTFMPAIDKDGKFIESALDNEAIKRLIDQNKETPEGKATISRVIAQQKAALENKLITSINNILSLPDNYAALVRPNDTYLLKDDIADKLEDDVTDGYNRFNNYMSKGQKAGVKAKRTISPTRTLEPLYNLHKHEANMIGKDVLGLVAIFNALHPVLNSLGASMPKKFRQSEYNRYTKQFEDSLKLYDTRLLMPHNETEDGRISLSDIYSADGKDLISDLYSQLINGTVDVEKDAWIFFMQANMELAPMLLLLFKAGVPPNYAVKFVSQPLIRAYAKEQRLLGSSYADLTADELDDKKGGKKKRAATKVLSKFGIINTAAFLKAPSNKYTAVNQFIKKDGILNNEGHFDIKILDEIIKNPDDTTYDDHQIAMFMHFLELEEQFSGIQDLLRLANPDTTTSKTTQEMMLKRVLLNNMSKNSKVDPELVRKLQKESILGTFYDNKIITDLIEPLFPLKNNKEVSNSIVRYLTDASKLIRETFGNGQDGQRQFITQFKNGLVNSLFQNAMFNYNTSTKTTLDIPTEIIEKYFTGDVFFQNTDYSFAEDVLAILEEHPELKEKYNVLLQLAKPELKDGQQILTLNDNKLLKDGQLASSYYENFKNLADPNVEKVKDTEKNLYISNMFKALPLMALYQNGVGYSKYGFNEALPFDDFISIMEPVSEDFIASTKKTDILDEVFDRLSDPKNKFFRNYVEVTPGRAVTKPAANVNVKTISEPYGVVVAETNPSETKTIDFINLIQPQIKAQAYQENRTGNKMFMYGLRWTRKNTASKPLNNKSYANKGLPITDAKATDGYVYDTVDQNGNALAPVSNLKPIIAEIEKSLGIDMSNYDAVIGNIYLPGQRIQTHRDTTESLSARNYPVVVYTIGAGNAINVYENVKNPGSASFASDKKIAIPTKNGTIYTFGMGGKGRFELGHDTPHAVKKGDTLDPITMPDGTVIKDYTITLTFRRAGDLAPGMPSSPTQPSTQLTVNKTKVLEGDIFALPGIPVITTNLGGVHGAGLAQAAKAKGLITQGDGNFKATNTVVQLPVKKKWSDSMAMNNNMELLKESLRSLIKTARDNKSNTYLLPLAGLGHGEGSVEDILPLLIKTVQAEDNIKLVLPAENVNLGRQGTIRKDTTRENMPKIKSMLEKAGLLSTQPTATGKQVTYAPVGKQRQTYTIRGAQIFNSSDVEVFKTDSVDRNKIFANLAVKEGRAVVVEHNGNKYAVNKKDQIISGVTGKIMNWPENNGDRKAILNKAAEEFGTSIDPIAARKTEILNSPEFKSWLANELSKNPNLDAEKALDYYIKCKGL